MIGAKRPALFPGSGQRDQAGYCSCVIRVNYSKSTPQEVMAAQRQLKQGQQSSLGPERLFPKAAPQLKPACCGPHMGAALNTGCRARGVAQEMEQGKGNAPQYQTPFGLPAVGYKTKPPDG